MQLPTIDRCLRLPAAAVVAVLAAGHNADAAVYRCTLPDAPPRFSQFPCPSGEVVVLEPLDTVGIPPITEAEQLLLDELEEQRRAAREERERARARAARNAEAQRDERRERCEAARVAQAALERKRRKGYTLAEARGLDRQADTLDAEIRQNC